MQAITTKYLGPTNYRPSRIKARCQAGTHTVSWDYGISDDDNHRAAALTLMGKLGWLEDGLTIIGSGTTHDNLGVHVLGRAMSE